MNQIKPLTIRRMEVEGEHGWWIDDPNNPDVRYVGPYGTKAEAQDDKKGLEYFWRYLDGSRTTKT